MYSVRINGFGTEIEFNRVQRFHLEVEVGDKRTVIGGEPEELSEDELEEWIERQIKYHLGSVSTSNKQFNETAAQIYGVVLEKVREGTESGN